MRTAHTLLCLFIAIWAQSECDYSQYELKLKVALVTGDEVIYYRTISMCDLELDSIKSNDYLQSVLFNTYDGAVEVKWYKHRAAYRFCYDERVTCATDEKATIYHSFVALTLPRTNVIKVEVVDHKRVSAVDGISTELQLSDTVMFQKVPKEVITCGGYLCYHRIAIYKNNPGLKTTMSAIRALNAEIAALGESLDSSNGDAFDERMWQLVEQLKTAQGMIVVSGCTD